MYYREGYTSLLRVLILEYCHAAMNSLFISISM
jgi:hypothetical protein